MDIQFCTRCRAPGLSRGKPNPEARLLRYVDPGDDGLCASCAATAFLKSVEPMAEAIGKNRDKLLWPPFQKGFTELMRVGKADAQPEEIDWQAVKDNWDLPFPKAKKKRRG